MTSPTRGTELEARDDGFPEHVTRLVGALDGWASIIAARYGHAVFLVGSALVKPDARDVDVRVVLPDDEWEARFDGSARAFNNLRPPRYVDEIGKLSRQVSRDYRFNVDFQVQPAGHVEQWGYDVHPRVVLANAPALVSQQTAPASQDERAAREGVAIWLYQTTVKLHGWEATHPSTRDHWRAKADELLDLIASSAGRERAAVVDASAGEGESDGKPWYDFRCGACGTCNAVHASLLRSAQPSEEGESEVKPLTLVPAHDWPEDFADDNGHYENICTCCGVRFLGHKRRVVCKACALAAAPRRES